MHPWKCSSRCKADPTSKTCKWRRRHKELITGKFCNETTTFAEMIAQYAPKLSYVALVELIGRRGPTSCRERNVPNIISLMPEMHPVSTTPGIVDKGQGIHRGGLRYDGAIGTIASDASMWSFADARLLTASELAKLMGHDTSTMHVGDITEAQFKKVIGLSLHVGTAGLMMAALLASLGHAP